MASAGSSDARELKSVAAQLEELAKAMNIGGDIDTISNAIEKIKEDLQGILKQSEYLFGIATKFLSDAPNLNSFLDSLSNCLKESEYMCKEAKDMKKFLHEECFNVFKKMCDHSEVTADAVNEMKNKLDSLQSKFKEFGQHLRNYEKNLQTASNLAPSASLEAEKQAERFRREASDLHSAAEKRSLSAWFLRIVTLGIITTNPRFQGWVTDNDQRYEEAETLKTVSSRFGEANNFLDNACKTLEDLTEQLIVPVQLSDEAIKAIRHVFNTYNKMSQLFKNMELSQTLLVEKDKQLAEQAEEISRLRSENKNK